MLSWSTKHSIVLVLTAFIATVMLCVIVSGFLEIHILGLLVTGVILGVIFLVFGRLPEFVREWFGIASDDDPANLSPKVYLPILLAVILLGCIAVAVAVAML